MVGQKKHKCYFYNARSHKNEHLTQNNLISIVTMWNKDNELSRENLSQRHEKRTKNPAETTGNRYKIEILMSRTQKLKGLYAASLILRTLNDKP